MTDQAIKTTKREQIKGQFNDLRRSPELSLLVRSLSTPSALKELSYLFFDWGLIVGCIIGILNFSVPVIVKLFLMFLLAGRQHALLTLVHEGAHYRISANKKLNDFISNFLAAYPLLFSTDWYRKHHMLHHLFLNTEQDPDVVRREKKPDWKFPQSNKKFVNILIKRILVGGYEWIILSMTISGLIPWKGFGTIFERFLRNRGVMIYFVAVLTLLVSSSLGLRILCIWFFGLLVIMPVFSHIRSISEHWGLFWEHDLNDARNVIGSPIEEFFIAPHGVNYHLDHHLFPSVPFYNLKRLHSKLMKYELYQNQAYHNSSYILPSESSVLKDVSRR